jgi:hypothetical protein
VVDRRLCFLDPLPLLFDFLCFFFAILLSWIISSTTRSAASAASFSRVSNSSLRIAAINAANEPSGGGPVEAIDGEEMESRALLRDDNTAPKVGACVGTAVVDDEEVEAVVLMVDEVVVGVAGPSVVSLRDEPHRVR